MFSRLVASSGGRSQFRSPAVIGGSLIAHAALLGGIVWLSAPATAEQAPEPDPNEEVTYIDITEIAPPPDMVFEEPPATAEPEPAAPTVAPPVVTRRAQPRAAPPNPAMPVVASPEPAGFQELRTPPRVIGVPPPDPKAVAVNPADFGGRGRVGGTAGGTRADSGDGRITGDARTGTTAGTGTAAAGPPTGTFSANLVDRKAELSNQRDVVRLLQREYPRQLASARIEGSVHVQFVITAEGRVDASTIRIVSATHPEFAEATKKVLQEFRFRPAQMGDHKVRMLTELPIQWTLARE